MLTNERKDTVAVHCYWPTRTRKMLHDFGHENNILQEYPTRNSLRDLAGDIPVDQHRKPTKSENR